jgi:NDP-sugar pyrophosphorylase family protein
VQGEVPTVFTGISVISPRAQELLPASGCLVRETLLAMLDEGLPVAGFLHDGFWSDIGTPAEYLRVNLAVTGGRAGALGAAGRLEGSRLIGENVRIGPGACIGRDVILGSGAVVEDGADLESCVVWDGARASGRIRSSIVGREHTVLVGEDA